MDAVQDVVATDTMRAVRIISAPPAAKVSVQEVELPCPGAGEVLVRVHAAALTRDELGWPTDRLPAIPSYELSGVVVALGPETSDYAPGDEVWAMTPFDRDGVAAEYALVPGRVLGRKPRGMSHARAASIPLPALSAWQALFQHGGLQAGQRVLVHGAGGAVGRMAVQLARWRGATVIGTASAAGLEAARASGAHQVVDRDAELRDLPPLDLVFDTVGGEALAESGRLVRDGGRIVSVAEPPRAGLEATYFVVEPQADQLRELGRLVEAGVLVPRIDSVFPLSAAQAAFQRLQQRGRTGKVVIGVIDE
jgi:NADPH:quinone reductase-like Zn-dependent oxidoreductase